MNNQSFSKYICKVIADFVLIIIIAFFIIWVQFTKITMQGSSMSPSIKDRESFLVSRFYKKLLPIKRYDIIAFYVNGQENVKRVVGLPGDIIRISSGNIYVNNIKVDERFFKDALSSNIEQNYEVRDNEFYVLGDNLDGSKDSRFEDFGNININNIIGKVWLVLK